MKKWFEEFKKKMKENKRYKYNFIFILSIFFLSFLINYFAIAKLNLLVSNPDLNVSYNDFTSLLEKNKVKQVTINYDESEFTFIDDENIQHVTSNPRIDGFKENLLKHDVVVEELNSTNKLLGTDFIRLLLTMAIMIWLLKRMMPDTDMQKQVKDVPTITFKDIAGNKELKTDMEYIVEFLKNPEKMEKAGARMPKGIVLYGPPGTGKTLLAKAIAGTAGVPFFSVSGSDFVEMYVGLGAKRVRTLFSEAKKAAPCIVFIDEIDAVGGKRGVSNNSEKDQTINALLTELDGFGNNSGIITICATNRVEDLDKALIRPGRFDKHLAVQLPEKDDREEIIKLYTKDRKFAEDVDFKDLASSTVGFSGADIEALINEASLLTAIKGNEIITNEDIENAFFRMVMKGDKKANQSSRDKEELKLVAWHESGHTLVTKLLTNDDVSKVTILSSTSGAGGVTFRNPPESQLHSKEYLEQSIKIMYGGRAAEEILFNGDTKKITTGASSDIKQATKLIKQYLLYFGMDNSFGMLNLDELQGDSYFSSLNDNLLQLASELSNRLYKETVDLLSENKELLAHFSNELLQNETLKSDDINRVIDEFNNREIVEISYNIEELN